MAGIFYDGVPSGSRLLLRGRRSISRMERDGHVAVAASGQDRRSRVVTMTEPG
jgi:hypothetical protein